MNTPDSTSNTRVSRETILHLEGGDIHVTEDGAPDAPALLLIHGSGSATSSWDAMVPLLTGSHHVIRIDLLGHGRSTKPDDGDYGIPAQADRVGAILDRLGVEHAIVTGHSSGGATATALAEQRPDLVDALALIDTGPHLGAFIAQGSAVEPAQWDLLTDGQIRQAMASAYSRVGYRPPQHVVDDVRAMTHHSFVATMQATREYLQQQALPGRLKTLGKPLLVIFGEDDRRWRSACAADYLVVHGAEVELLPGVGHSPILEDPARTAESLLAFTTTAAHQKDGAV